MQCSSGNIKKSRVQLKLDLSQIYNIPAPMRPSTHGAHSPRRSCYTVCQQVNVLQELPKKAADNLSKLFEDSTGKVGRH
jgi:hypothetical protein